MSWKAKVAVVGAGNLGGALAAGLLRSGLVSAENLIAADRSAERLADLRAAHGLTQTTEDNAEAVDGADVVVVAVKPHIVAAALEEIASRLEENQVVISMAAAVPISRLEASLPEEQPVIRAMPNIAMTAGASATALCANEFATEAHREAALKIFGAVGVVEFVEEAQMHAVTALSGSGPAYGFLLLEGLAAGGVKMGLAPATAQRLAAQTLLGAAKMALESDLHPGALRDQVTTPGGTTIAGLHELEIGGVRASLMSAVEAAAERSFELAQLLDD